MKIEFVCLFLLFVVFSLQGIYGQQVFNVMDFGAKGDGITNDTAAIQATIEKVL